MSLSAGTSLGPYEIVSPLGEGGMGEVFRARDTKLDREVALKILPESFANDPGRLMRFTREAKTLAALNHPNIAAIYGIEEGAVSGSEGGGGHESGTVPALVMELVEGEDLSALITRGPIAFEEALPMAAVLRADIDLEMLPGSTPEPVRRLLARCLDRDPRTRLRDSGEARVALADPVSPETPVAREPVWQSPTLWIAAAALVAVTVLATWSVTGFKSSIPIFSVNQAEAPPFGRSGSLRF